MKKKLKKVISLIVVLLAAGSIYSQDTLPKFTLTDRGGRVTISWVNPYENLTQLNVQRSYDSLRNFATIYSATSPQLPQNGYTELKPATNRIYYRIFYAFEGGSYFFSKPIRAGGSAITSAVPGGIRDAANTRDLTNNAFSTVVPGDKRVVTIKLKDAIFRTLSVNAFRNFRDSILLQTRDTIYTIDESTIGITPYIAVAAYKTSSYVYINKDGFINIAVPQVNEKKYHIKFFEADGESLFEISNVKESPLILDKSNFIHSGWFLFELYEENKLKEKNKFYVPKDF
jgi:hypothetical protein